MTLLQKIEQHLKRSGQCHTHFGRVTARDPNLVKDMRQGREIGVKLAGRIECYLSETRETGN